MRDNETDNVGRCFDAHGRALVLYARQWLDDSGARDAVQEAFVRLLRRHELPPNALAWLYRTVRSTAIDALRRDRRRRRREQRATAGRATWFTSRPDDPIDAVAAQAALTTLPQEQQEVIVLRLWSDLTLAEVADVCETPVSTVFSRYRAGLAAIRERLARTDTPANLSRKP